MDFAAYVTGHTSFGMVTFRGNQSITWSAHLDQNTGGRASWRALEKRQWSIQWPGSEWSSRESGPVWAVQRTGDKCQGHVFRGWHSGCVTEKETLTRAGGGSSRGESKKDSRFNWAENGRERFGPQESKGPGPWALGGWRGNSLNQQEWLLMTCEWKTSPRKAKRIWGSLWIWHAVAVNIARLKCWTCLPVHFQWEWGTMPTHHQEGFWCPCQGPKVECSPLSTNWKRPSWEPEGGDCVPQPSAVPSPHVLLEWWCADCRGYWAGRLWGQGGCLGAGGYARALALTGPQIAQEFPMHPHWDAFPTAEGSELPCPRRFPEPSVFRLL